MDWTQIGIAIFIPLFVSLIAWALTYIIPYVSPNWISNRILWITKDDPKDPIEIGLIINQFSKYDDWKRLTAYKRMKKMFIEKVIEIQEYNNLEWDKLKFKVINIPLESLLDKLNLVLSDINDEKISEINNGLLPDDFKEHFKKHKEQLEKNQKKFSEIIKTNKNTIIWGLCYIPPKYIKKYSKGNYVLNLKELELMDSTYPIFDEKGSMTVDEFLELKNYKKPEILSEEEIVNTFNDVILYIDYPNSKKEELIYRLALGLSDHKLSHETLVKLINEAKGQISHKDYKEWKKRMNIR